MNTKNESKNTPKNKMSDEKMTSANAKKSTSSTKAMNDNKTTQGRKSTK